MSHGHAAVSMSLTLGRSMVTGGAFPEINEVVVSSRLVVCSGNRMAATDAVLGVLAFALCNFLCWAKAHNLTLDWMPNHSNGAPLIP